MIIAPICYKRGCIYYTGIIQPDETELTECHACSAFPNGIPSEILTGKNKHFKKLPTQKNNIVFKTNKK